MIFPGIGTAVGAVIGGILGFFANLVIGDVLADANGITGDKYCKIMLAALNDFEINVPVYSYKVGSFIDHKPMAGGTVEGNLTKYVNGKLSSTFSFILGIFIAQWCINSCPPNPGSTVIINAKSISCKYGNNLLPR